jgi:hypothetical protein
MKLCMGTPGRIVVYYLAIISGKISPLPIILQDRWMDTKMVQELCMKGRG